jgi:hypothetical protein
MRTRVVVIAIAGAAALTLQAQPMRSPRWPAHAAIAVWIDPQSAPPGAAALVERALATWTRAAAGRFALKRAGAGDPAAIRVRFARADGIYGETAPRIDRRTGVITAAEVLIAGEIPGDAMRQQIVIYLTALHELGHALGLPHTNAFDDIMYSFRRADDGERYFGAYRRRLRGIEEIGAERATGLSPADMAALTALYDH